VIVAGNTFYNVSDGMHELGSCWTIPGCGGLLVWGFSGGNYPCRHDPQGHFPCQPTSWSVEPAFHVALLNNTLVCSKQLTSIGPDMNGATPLFACPSLVQWCSLPQFDCPLHIPRLLLVGTTPFPPSHIEPILTRTRRSTCCSHRCMTHARARVRVCLNPRSRPRPRPHLRLRTPACTQVSPPEQLVHGRWAMFTGATPCSGALI
jgi:hypothetical protein